ncbi:hypothetical protein ABIA65_000533 [Mycolicibacterium sp. 624]
MAPKGVCVRSLGVVLDQAKRFIALAFLLLIAVAVGVDQQARGYEASTAPAGDFSAERAFRIVQDIAREPHPMGTPAHARVRERLVSELADIGLEPEIHEGVGRWPEDIDRDTISVGHVSNIIARVPGSDPSGTIYLAAHYDSVPSGPGANDDSVGVAAVLETVRALRSAGSALRNDVVVLLTDGEEAGLLGAEAFVHALPQSTQPGIVINHEARGAGGPPLLWRVTAPDGGLIRAVEGAAPHPAADSLSTALGASMTSSTTDLAAFGPGGLAVLDWAYVGGGAYYHNRLDDPAHVNLATVQQMGDNTIALTRELGQRDLASLSDDRNRSYFQLPAGLLVVFPSWVTIALAVLALVGLAVVVGLARRAGEATLTRVLAAAVTALAAAAIAVAATFGLWWVLSTVRPGYTLLADPYRPWPYYGAMVLLAVAVLLMWYALSRKWFGPKSALLGMLCCVVVAGAILTFTVPTAGHLLVIPAVAALAGWLITYTGGRGHVVVMAVALVPAAVFLSGSIWPSIQLGVGTAPFAVVPAVVLLTGLMLPLLEVGPPAAPLSRRYACALPAVPLALALVLAATGLAVDRFDESHPMPSELKYALDADNASAQWISRMPPDRWNGGFVSDASPEGAFSELWSETSHSGPAAAVDLPAPAVDITSDTVESGDRRLRLRLRSLRGATAIGVHFEAADIRSLTVAGRDITPVPADGFRFYAPPPEGLEVEIVAPSGPLTLRVSDYLWLPDSGLPAFEPPPADMFLAQDSESAVFTTPTI